MNPSSISRWPNPRQSCTQWASGTNCVGRGYLLIALTGWGQEGTRKKALEAGFDFHVVKPVDIDVLKSYIAQSLAPQASTG